MSDETERLARLAEIFKHGTPAVLHRDDDGIVHVEEVDILDVLRSQLGEAHRALDDHLATLYEEEIEQFRKDANETHVDRALAAVTMRQRRERLRAFLDENRPTN